MDCCGMPMAAWPGGGLVCRKCQAKVGVSWRRDRNPFSRCVESPVEADAAPEPEVVPLNFQKTVVILDPGPAPAAPAMIPVEQPKVSGFGRGGRKGGPK